MTVTKNDPRKLESQAEAIYSKVRPRIETPENIGRMVIIDTDSGDYEIDPVGVIAARRLKSRHPEGRFFGIRIGYEVAVTFGAMMRRRES